MCVDTIFHVRTITADYAQSSDASSTNTPLIIVKNEIDVIAYAENNQTNPSDSCFNGRRGKINHGGRRHNNKTCSTDKKTKINPLRPEGNTTVYFMCGCKFRQFYDCSYIDDTKDKYEDSKNGSYLSLSNMIMMS